MDLNYTAEEIAFRDEVRTFLKEKLPPRLSQKVKASKRLTKADYELWHSILNERGWLDFTFQNYYLLLNCGFRLRPTGGTASGVHPVPLGFGRVYVSPCSGG